MKKLLAGLSIVVLLLSGCSSNDDSEDKNIVIGATPTPHALILEVARAEVEALGYTLEIVEFTDYILPNTTLDAGDLDANFFQHVPYLNSFNNDRGTDLSSVLTIHFEPLGLYPNPQRTLEDLKTPGLTIAIPNDPTNETRALRLLEDNGYISFEANASGDLTPIDIVDNPYNYTFVEMEAALLAQTLVDVDFAIINGNYALGAEIEDQVILTEDTSSLAAQTFANVLVVQTGKENDPKTLILIEALSSQSVKDYIEDTFYPTVISMLP